MDLLKAIQTESIEVIKDVISKGGIPREFEWLNYAALNSALEHGRFDVAELLLKRNCCINTTFPELGLDSSPLHHAVKLGDSKLVINLLKRGAFISTVDGDRNTPLHLAFIHKHKEIVDIILNFMVQTSVYVDIKNIYGLTHLHIASTTNNVTLIESYLRGGALISDSVSNESLLWAGFIALHFAVQFKSISALKVLSKNARQFDFEKKDKKGRTPREMLKDHLEDLLVMDKILAQGSLSYFELTCLQDKESNADILNSFIEHGADVNLQMAQTNSFCSCFTPLHFAVNSGNTENVKVLLKNNANGQFGNMELMTPLHQAFYYETLFANSEIVDLLYKAFIDKEVDRQDINGLSYLHIACTRNDLATVKKILDSGRSVDSKVSYCRQKYSHYTPLHFAVQYKQIDVAKLLIERSANVNANNNSVYGTPLHLAFLVGNIKMIELLLQNGADVKAICSVNGVTMLHVLIDCCVNRLDVSLDHQCLMSYVDKLVDLGVDLNAQDSTGFTALHVTCTGYRPNCIMRLLKLGSDVNIKNKHGKTPFEMIFDDCFKGQDRVLYYIIFHEHVQKLKALGLTVRAKNTECCEKVLLKRNELGEKSKVLLSEKMNDFEQQRVDELAKLKSTKINDQLSLWEFLKLRANRAANFVDSKVLLELFISEGLLEKEYPAFGYFIHLQYRKGLSSKQKRTMEVDDSVSSMITDA